MRSIISLIAVLFLFCSSSAYCEHEGSSPTDGQAANTESESNFNKQTDKMSGDIIPKDNPNPTAISEKDKQFAWSLNISWLSLLFAALSPWIYWKIYKFERGRHERDVAERTKRHAEEILNVYWTTPILIPLFIEPLKDFSLKQIESIDELSKYENNSKQEGKDQFKESLAKFNNELHKLNEIAIILKAMDGSNYKKWRNEVEKTEDAVTNYCANYSLGIEKIPRVGNTEAKAAIINLLSNVVMDLLTSRVELNGVKP